MAVKQRHLEEAVTSTTINAASQANCRSTPRRRDVCGQPGHFTRNCQHQPRIASPRSPTSNKGLIQCYSCQGYGHVARNCTNNVPLNEQGVRSPVGMNATRPSIFMNMSINIPTHPFVECNIEGVNAHALIDIGSMKSFIYNTIDFEGTRLGKVNEQCKSLTGDPLNLSGKLNASIKFIGSRYSYSDNFLARSDIHFDCILGWDFLVNNQLTVQRDTSGGISFYSLTGPHGKTRVCAKAVSNAKVLKDRAKLTQLLRKRQRQGQINTTAT